jgi:hypothetical protein
LRWITFRSAYLISIKANPSGLMHEPPRKGWEPPRGKAVLSDGAFLPYADRISGPPLPWFLRMAEKQQIVKPCPICGVAMVRQDEENGAILYRCCLCETEVKIAPATNKSKEA